MQHTFDSSISARIARRNSAMHVHFRLTARFSLLYFAVFVAALLLNRVFPITSLSQWDSFWEAAIHSPLTDNVPARDQIRAILYATRYDMSLLLLLLLSGMTLFSERACGTLLCLHSFLLGLLCLGLTQTYPSLSAIRDNAAPMICALAQFANAAVLLTAADEAVIFSYRYRDSAHKLRRERESLCVRYILQALVLIGTVTAISAIRALLLTALQNI